MPDAGTAPMIWAYLLPMGYNMGNDRVTDQRDTRTIYTPHLRFDDSVWADLFPRMVDSGVNMVVIDLCDGIRYRSHPEIALPDAWSLDRLGDELGRMREAGIEPIPKLNFSATHDVWLGRYARMLSTPVYYQVVSDLIAEVIELFDTPRFFHLGMDEETAEHQQHHAYAVMRQHELWWHDLRYMVDCVDRGGSRAWVWSDFLWHHHDEYLLNMPSKVLQSNWYYGEHFNGFVGDEKTHVSAYDTLEQNSFDQIPTGSNHSNTVNFGRTVAYCRDRISPERLMGFLMTVWRPPTEKFRDQHIEALGILAKEQQQWDSD
jgi:hypothetical protein